MLCTQGKDLNMVREREKRGKKEKRQSKRNASRQHKYKFLRAEALMLMVQVVKHAASADSTHCRRSGNRSDT